MSVIPRSIDYEASMTKSIMAVGGYARDFAHFTAHHILEAESMKRSRDY